MELREFGVLRSKSAAAALRLAGLRCGAAEFGVGLCRHLVGGLGVWCMFPGILEFGRYDAMVWRSCRAGMIEDFMYTCILILTRVMLRSLGFCTLSTSVAKCNKLWHEVVRAVRSVIFRYAFGRSRRDRRDVRHSPVRNGPRPQL